MSINEKKLERIFSDLNKKYLKKFIENYFIFGEKNLSGLKDKRIFYPSNHLSHFDSFLIPLILNNHGLPPSSIIAGKNLDVWPLNKIISRETGAIFVDRKKIEEGNMKTKKEELIKIKKSVEDVVSGGKSLMVFLEGGRSYDGKIMESPKERYPKEYLSQILNQNKDKGEYFGVNIAINYKPHTIEKPFLEAVKFFKGKFFPLYLGFDILAFLTQPIRKKPTAYVNFGEPYPLKEFIEKQDYRGLTNFAKEEVKRLYEEIK
ncbi:MAG: 1-acyl-sn-glycerol-3-phosphate acyltransferase [Nanoarchaeota archaeon]|nr:1-acyl-sn-glycerol-3-phosphate acyltransferase [Nanoarchaeota archaeon]